MRLTISTIALTLGILTAANALHQPHAAVHARSSQFTPATISYVPKPLNTEIEVNVGGVKYELEAAPTEIEAELEAGPLEVEVEVKPSQIEGELEVGSSKIEFKAKPTGIVVEGKPEDD
ncbi:hypothetical protein MPDQ_005602 [Monascus purpureus]|uniref:Uncharacterized protein n=1 Tax=Monascus purpureus TaxID=5098 RepID=A0A507R036_MONPU|nr:hypothetical protein MPDQ_005602 [Monascus purpureus]BDD56232.1 hypothetical protein MAP00_001706 [Monascus purpureus]